MKTQNRWTNHKHLSEPYSTWFHLFPNWNMISTVSPKEGYHLMNSAMKSKLKVPSLSHYGHVQSCAINKTLQTNLAKNHTQCTRMSKIRNETHGWSQGTRTEDEKGPGLQEVHFQATCLCWLLQLTQVDTISRNKLLQSNWETVTCTLFTIFHAI